MAFLSIDFMCFGNYGCDYNLLCSLIWSGYCGQYVHFRMLGFLCGLGDGHGALLAVINCNGALGC